ncbi:MAG: deoxyribose-phosphate aldolase [Deltaproteobacteria bacterium]|nr:deoxyribose-phosphate aldolase [Deltaproteobacteria bacterium]
MAMVRLKELDNRFEADVWSDVLTQEGIAFRIRSYMDTAYDGLFVSQKGYATLFVEEEDLPRAQALEREMAAGQDAALSEAGELARALEHTLLDPEAGVSELAAHLAQCRELGVVGACVSPWMVSQAAQVLEGSGILVVSVVGFPLGTATGRAKLQEALDLAREGAHELDLVLNRGLVRSGRLDQAVAEVAEVAAAVAPRPLKVILETSRLGPDLTRLVAAALAESGAAFLKTGSGYFGAATPADVALLREAAPELPVKAAGGIRDLAGARALLEAGATRLGSSAGAAILAQAREA